jgi:hypothetical protein
MRHAHNHILRNVVQLTACSILFGVGEQDNHHREMGKTKVPQLTATSQSHPQGV